MKTNENLTLEEILKIHRDIIRKISELDLKKLMIKEIKVVFDDEEYFEKINNGEKTGKQGFCDSFYKKKP